MLDNIKKCTIKKMNAKFSNMLKERNDIIKEQYKTINELEIRINKEINEMQSILVDIDKSIRVCELNDKKPMAIYHSLQNAKMKIKSSIADSKQLLNLYGYKYIPKTNFTIVNLKNQDVR